MAKYCKECKELNENPLLKYCFEHKDLNKWIKQWSTISSKPYKINSVSKTNKNTPAKFSQKTKDEILFRDKNCIICTNKWAEFHHAYYWYNSNRWANRNDSDQWVLLCWKCHHSIHHWTDWTWRIKRAKCIIRLKQLK